MTVSIRKITWKQKEYCPNKQLAIMQKFEACDNVSKILASKNLSLIDVENFLNPKIRNLLPDPLHLKDMQEAIERTFIAITNKQKIVIFGDYDVDGATSSALIKNYLNEVEVNASVYIPDRISEGYGLNLKSLSNLIEKYNPNLIITVDCGTMSFEAIDYANTQNIDVIVIDHHIGGLELPKACAIINPNRLDETSEYKDLAAVGVSFLFLIALNSYLKKQNYFDKIKVPDLLSYLDLVALGTVCDVMPLTGLNRAFVLQGLHLMNLRKNLGISGLLDLVVLSEKVNAYHLGFVIGPRINAGGRVGLSSLGSELLSSDNIYKIKEIAVKLNEYNIERQAIEMRMLEEAFLQAESQSCENIIYICGENWHQGIIGIIASRIKEKYNKATIVISCDGDTGKSSCRSVTGFDIGKAVINAKIAGIIKEGGGHAMAAGFSVEKDKILELHEFFKNYILNFKDCILQENYKSFDGFLNINGINLDLVKRLEKLGPFGTGNYEPVFMISNLYVLKASILKEKHLKILFASDKNTGISKAISVLAFNANNTSTSDIIMSRFSHKLSVLVKMSVNNYLGKESVQLILEDVILEGSY